MGTIVISGGGTLAAAIALRLAESGAAVERISAGAEASEAPDAQLARAAVLVLAADSDSGNVDLALQTRRKYPTLALVVRLFDASLASYLTETISGVTILSMSRVAAPVFADAARKILAAPPPAVAPKRPARAKAGSFSKR